jgi:hypothetical protein
MRRRKTYIIFLLIITLIGIRIYRQYQTESIIIEDNVFSDIQDRIDIDTGIVCILIPKKTYYRIGERPQLDVLIINKTDSTIYLPGSLDGSDVGIRLPYCDFLVMNRNMTQTKHLDLNPNQLTNLDLQVLEPNDCFNPLSEYKILTHSFANNSGINWPKEKFSELHNFWEPQSLQGGNFLIPGNYEIQFVYSTISDDKIILDWNISENNFDEFNIDLIDSIPRIKIQSNIVTLKYRLL